MKFSKSLFYLLLWVVSSPLVGQTHITVHLDSVQNQVGNEFQPGVFYVPKTVEAQNDFLNNGIRQNAIRLHVIESALNNASDLAGCLSILDGAQTVLQDLANKTDKLIFIFEKMPGWLSSSTDASPAATPGWSVLHTKAPSNYTHWDAMVVAVVSKLVNDFGIDNAYFEFWNEPDLGSWTGSNAEYFKLYQHTRDAVKSVNANLPFGGAATNFWANHINYQPPYGYLSSTYGDSSLLSDLIDSTTVWNKPLDFISWHSFNISYQTNANAVEYIHQKCLNLGVSTPELIISEWNTQSEVRETPLQKAYFVKNLMEMAELGLSNNVVAAWQDFEQTTDEFHKDYGLLSYGSIHKPAYKALLLALQTKGERLYTSSNAAVDIIVTAQEDTLNVLITNYVPPALVEALNHTLFDGHLRLDQLDSAGYINVNTGDISHLDSIYQGWITLAGNDAISVAINNAIPVYAHFDSLQGSPRNFTLNLQGLTGQHTGTSVMLNDTLNNSHFKYDSLLSQGLTQANAIAQLTSNQDLTSTQVSLNNGTLAFTMHPNAVQSFQFIIPELLFVENLVESSEIHIYPNPTTNILHLESAVRIGEIRIVDAKGALMLQQNINASSGVVDVSNLNPGVYFVQLKDALEVWKFIKH